MIESLRLQNFKGHRDTTVDLGRLTVLVGPNGSGKTSLLQALGVLRDIVDDAPVSVLSGNRAPKNLLTRNHEGPIKLSAVGRIGGEPWHADLTVELSKADANDEPRWAMKADHDGEGVAKKRSLVQLRSITQFQFDAARIAAPAYDEDARGRVEPDGRNTATALNALLVRNDGSFSAVQDALKRLVPTIERIFLLPARVSGKDAFTKRTVTSELAQLELSGQRIVFDFKGAPGVPAEHASEGTLVLLALLTALHANGPSGLILIDDIEHALHPTAQIELVKHLRGLLDQMPELQIVATTHSPYILEGVDPSDVRVFYPRKDGSIVTKRLSDHPEAARVKGMLSSGELWSSESEAWVLGEEAKA